MISNLIKMEIVLITNAIFSLEIFFVPVMVAFYLNYIGMSFLEMTYFFSVILFLNILFEIPSGALSDTIGRKRAYLIGKTIYVVAMILLLFANSFLFLLLIALLFSIGNSLASGNLSAIIYQNLSFLNQKKESFFSILAKTSSICFLFAGIASIVGGYLGTYDIRIPLIVDIFLVILNIFIGYLFIEELDSSTIVKKKKTLNLIFISIKTNIINGFNASIDNKSILFIILFSSIVFSVLRAGFNFYQPILESVDINLVFFGNLLFFFNIIAAITSYFFSKTSKNFLENNSLIYLTIVLLLLSGITLFNFTSYTYVIIAFLIHQIIRGYYLIYTTFAINIEIPINHESRTTILSFKNFFTMLLATITMSISGMLVSITNLHYSFIIMSIFGGIFIFCILLMRSKKRKQKL